MRQGRRKPVASSPKRSRGTSEVRRSISCNKSAFDRFCFAHILFGVYTACICVGITSLLVSRFGYSREMINLIVAVLVPSAILAIILLDVIEHTTVRRGYFQKKLGDKNWCESMGNVLCDIIFAFIAFIAVFMSSVYFVRDPDVMTFIAIVPFFFMPLFIFIIWNSTHKKWKGFYFDKKPRKEGKFYWKQTKMSDPIASSGGYEYFFGKRKGDEHGKSNGSKGKSKASKK